jgi:hypothetical protein
MKNKLYKCMDIILISSLPILYPCISHSQMEIRSEDPESYYQIGTIHFDGGDNDQAILYFNKSIFNLGGGEAGSIRLCHSCLRRVLPLMLFTEFLSRIQHFESKSTIFSLTSYGYKSIFVSSFCKSLKLPVE